jgi:2-methylisocitrate lyase-like PEP mutase family enzyme
MRPTAVAAPPGDPLLLPNAWDVATARAVVAGGFPVVATTSAGVAATLGSEDHPGGARSRSAAARDAYVEAGVASVYPIALWQTDALRRFMSDVHGPVTVVRLPQAPSLVELVALGVAG